jgi:hypothetical protein
MLMLMLIVSTVWKTHWDSTGGKTLYTTLQHLLHKPSSILVL